MSAPSQTQPPRQRPQHLCIRPLTIYDLDQVEALEARGFDDAERASREKLKYRLSVCPELSSGYFVREFEDIGAEAVEKKKMKKEHKVEDQDDQDDDDEFILPPPRSTVKKETLIGHIMGTKIYDQKITERTMGIPKLTEDLLPDPTVPNNDKVGHVEGSRIIGIHSVVIDQKYRGLKLGSLLVKDYLQKMNQQCVADRVVLIAKEKLVPFYKSIEFVDDGISKCKYAGVDWHDLHCVLTHEEDDDDM
ncbi:hypothetical protein FOA43_004265 [Brettanomyces nanus]|uniref:N-acetyltransferase domain-containing protein n=1 Tax=Eeniella nana TaxID=13502 RepID=A0A875S5G5_EENNA|nr:uncharacterized protein FOA43_004265 [Brettanomyces nanus]QPG76871.1 hypothetical protein FOA43_004265 [Brettanomyces nanus]